MLDRNSRLAVPDESYFVPLLARRHRGTVDPDAFLDDLRRLATLREWELEPAEVGKRLTPGMSTGAAIATVYEAYAAAQGKERWGDKTPMYMQHLRLLERLFPDAQFVHLVRDGRDVARSFLAMPEGIVTRTWAHPTSVGEFACEWRDQVGGARSLGRRVGPGRYHELRYERLVADPTAELRAICEFAGLPFEPGMLAYAGKLDLSRKPHQQSLTRPPTPGLRDWRRDLAPADVQAFEAVAGDLLAELGYPVAGSPRTTARGRLRRARYAALTTAWNATAAVLQRSPVWRRRHPRLA
jgi:hypothetical protein